MTLASFSGRPRQWQIVHDQASTPSRFYELAPIKSWLWLCQRGIECTHPIGNSPFDGLVQCQVVTVHVDNSSGVDVSVGNWTALKMTRYLCSLDQCPQYSQHVLQIG